MKYLSLLLTALIAAFSGLCAQDLSGPETIETPFFRFTLWGADGHCEMIDKEANVTWRAEANPARFGQVTLRAPTNRGVWISAGVP